MGLYGLGTKAGYAAGKGLAKLMAGNVKIPTAKAVIVGTGKAAVVVAKVAGGLALGGTIAGIASHDPDTGAQLSEYMHHAHEWLNDVDRGL